jgi:hypothetical protein
MLKYKNGIIIKKSDFVLIEKGKTKGKIYDIIDTEEKEKYWGVNEKGVIIESSSFGLVFWSMDDGDDIVFVERNR